MLKLTKHQQACWKSCMTLLRQGLMALEEMFDDVPDEVEDVPCFGLSREQRLAVDKLIAKGEHIQAIKLLRQLGGEIDCSPADTWMTESGKKLRIGLKEAKEWCDARRVLIAPDRIPKPNSSW